MRFKLRPLMIWLVLSTPVWTPVQAQGIEVDKNVPKGMKRPRVSIKRSLVVNITPPVVSIKRVPVVDIAEPSAGGVSNNRFTNFNVERSGVVLNNSVEATNTTLAGNIAGNDKLGKTGPAAVILNQVTETGGPSQLLGQLEVGGTAARVIVANPNGIVCHGCGFLNANRVTLTTGKPTFNDNDELIGLEVTSGHLRIAGRGLDGEQRRRQVDVDLVAYSLELDNATIRARALNIVVGPNHVGLVTDDITDDVSAVDAAPDAPPPQFTLGMGGLGSIIVKKGIRALATDAGVGMNIGNNLSTRAGDVSIDVAGDVYIHRSATLTSSGKLNVKTGRHLKIAGTAFSVNGPMNLTASQDVEVEKSSLVVSQRSRVKVVGRTLSVAGTVDSPHDNVHLDAKGTLELTGTVRADKSLKLKAKDSLHIDINAYASGSGPVLLAAGHDVTIDGRVEVPKRRLTLTAGKNLTVGMTGRLKADGDPVDKNGLMRRPDKASLTAGRNVKIDGRVEVPKGQLTLTAGKHLKVGMTGQLETGRNLVALADDSMFIRGRTWAKGEMTLNAKNALTLGDSDTMQVRSVNLDRDVQGAELFGIKADGELRIQVGGNFTTLHSLESGLNTILQADGDATLGGAITAERFIPEVAGEITRLDTLRLEEKSSPVQWQAGRELPSGRSRFETKRVLRDE